MNEIGAEDDAASDARRCDESRRLKIALLLIVIGFPLAALLIGLSVPQVMIGDEVTHFYMLVHQADVLPGITFDVPIQTGWGEPEVRRYAHANAWHYIGAWLYRGSPHPATVQIYHTLFFAQLLIAGYILIRRRANASGFAAMVYLLVLATLPMSLLFSVAFYQDVPMAAQVLTAFCLLERRRWGWATLFLVFALGMKETAVLFIPPFLVMLAAQRWSDAGGGQARSKRVVRTLVPIAVSALLLWVPMKASDHLLAPYGGYYPFRQVRSVAEKIVEMASSSEQDSTKAVAPEKKKVRSLSVYESEISAYHPGDLRVPENWLLYGGGVLWVVVAAGAAGWVLRRTRFVASKESLRHWPFWVGLSFVVPTAVLLKASPDARFFYPALPFLLVPVAESAARIVRPRVWISVLAALCLVQAGSVLMETRHLRSVSPALEEGIEFLREHRPEPPRVFMYPEGNYRLFPVPHDWYVGGHLRDFWHGDNDHRLHLLARRRIGAIVIKKYRVAPVDAAISNMGVYPDYFGPQLDADARFRRVFDNDAVAIYEFDAPELQPFD